MHNEGAYACQVQWKIVGEVEMLEQILTTEKSFPRPVSLFNVRLNL